MTIELTIAPKDLNEEIKQIEFSDKDEEKNKDEFYSFVFNYIEKLDFETVFLIWSEFTEDNDATVPSIIITENNHYISDILLEDIKCKNFTKFNIFEFDSYEEALIYLKDFYDGFQLTYSKNTNNNNNDINFSAN